MSQTMPYRYIPSIAIPQYFNIVNIQLKKMSLLSMLSHRDKDTNVFDKFYKSLNYDGIFIDPIDHIKDKKAQQQYACQQFYERLTQVCKYNNIHLKIKNDCQNADKPAVYILG